MAEQTQEVQKAASRVAVITGASSGLGALFAQRIDALGEVDEICLIARRKDKLEEVGAKLSCHSIILVQDLSSVDAASKVASALEGKSVCYLVNCAGFGKIGTFSDIPIADEDAMIEVNCKSAVDITYSLLPLMGRGSCVINVCSVAAFQPFQHLAIYAASKAFLLSWSRSLRWELKKSGIHVTALCPYWMRNTAFIANAQAGKGGGDIHSFPFCDDEHNAVAAALWGARLNMSVVTVSFVGLIHRVLCKIIPRDIMQYVWEVLRNV